MTQAIPSNAEAMAAAATSQVTRRIEDGASVAPPIPESAHGILAQVGGHGAPTVEAGERLRERVIALVGVGAEHRHLRLHTRGRERRA